MAKDDKPLVRGNHLPADPGVTEGGKAPSPNDGPGHPKASASRAEEEGRSGGDTSPATQGRREKDHADAQNAGKPQAKH